MEIQRPMEPASYRIRLSVMMFGLYLILGSWAVTLSTYLISSPLLGGLSFSANSVSWIYNTWAFGGLLAPLFIGLLADRLFAVQKLLAACSILAGGLLLCVAFWCESQQKQIETVYRNLAAPIVIDGLPMLDLQQQFLKDPKSVQGELRENLVGSQKEILQNPILRSAIDEAFFPLFGLMFAASFFTIMTIGCSNVMGFRNLKEPEKNYGRIRLFGTTGWIVAGLCIAAAGKTISHFPLFFAAIVSFAMGLYYLTLPNTPPMGTGKTLGEAFGVPALKLFRHRPFRILISSLFMMSAVQQFYGVYANKFLNDIGVPKPSATQTLAQVGEVLCMMFLPWVVDRIGLKRTMLLGLLGWSLRNALFATNSLPVVILVGLPLHGLSFTFFFVTAMIYVDRQSPRELRASTQGIFTFVGSGMGVLTGNMLSAWFIRLNREGESIHWQPFWLVPCIMSAIVFCYFLIGFRPKRNAVHLEKGEATRHMVEDIEELAGT